MLTIEEKIQAVVELLTTEFTDKGRGQKVLDLLSENMENFATAPGSINVDFHHCYPGGLLDYTLDVHKVLTTLHDLFPKPNYTVDELTVAVLLHAFGRAGTVTQPYYLSETDRWRVGKGYRYRIDPKLGNMDIEQRTLYQIQQAGIDLTENEYLGIMLHRSYGSSDTSRYTFNDNISNLPMLLHYATMISSKRGSEKNLTVTEKPVKKASSKKKIEKLAEVVEKRTIAEATVEKIPEASVDEAKKLWKEMFAV